MSEKIRDIHTSLPEKVDLSDSINKSIKISKGVKMKDLRENLKHLKLRKKRTVKLSKLKNIQLDPITKKSQATINTNNKQRSFLKKIFTKKGYTRLPISQKILFFLIGLVFLGLLDKVILETSLRNGYQHLLNIKQKGTNTVQIEEEIQKAQRNLFLANIFYTPVSFIPHPNIQSVGSLITGGNHTAELLKNTLGIYKKANSLISKNKIENINFIEFLEEIEANKDNIKKYLYNALIAYKSIHYLPNKDLSDKLHTGKKMLLSAYNLLDTIDDNYDIIKNIFGNYEERTYFIALQNNDEIRATGGFTGSFGILKLENGKIKSFESKDVYALEWKINKVYTEKLPAPVGLASITETFGLRDANYYPDINDSANRMKYFLEKTGIKVDGIIFINQNTIKELLTVIGGVESETLGYYITGDNFSEIISTITESEVTKEGVLGTPKQGLFDFSGEFYTKLLAEKKYFDYFRIITSDVAKRDIIVYSFKSNENSLLWKLGLNGSVNYNNSFDFSYPVYTSIGGNKTDRYIKYDYEKHIQKVGSCNYHTDLIIYNEHTFSKNDENRVRKLLQNYTNTGKPKNDILNIQGKGENKSFLRILVPKNAAITLSEGQTVTQKANYQVINLFTSTPAGKKSSYKVSYDLYNPSCEKYGYIFYKQPGISKYDISFLENGNFTDYKNITTDFIFNRDKIQ